MYGSTLFFLQLPVFWIEFKLMHRYEFLISGKITKSHLNKINVSPDNGEDTIYYILFLGYKFDPRKIISFLKPF